MQAKVIILELMRLLDCSTQQQLAEKIGRNPAYISQSIKRNRLSPKLIDYICAKFPFINRDYLMTGGGNSILSGAGIPDQTKQAMINMIIDSYRRLSPEVQEVLMAAFKRIAAEQGRGINRDS